ncbi:hypothetical protein JXD20_00235 [Candidatus Peregrinibacteria bacterium]|nr:hypothetical protein [Candidatus Peregrinibacteria bacterium]
MPSPLEKRGLAARGRRIQVLMLLSALGLSSCGKEETNSVPISAPSTTPSAIPSALPYGEFGKGDYRGEFARKFSETLEIRQGSDGFFLPVNYLWKLEGEMIKAGRETGEKGILSCEDLGKEENAVLAISLDRLFDEWTEMSLEGRMNNIFRGRYVQEVYRHYYFLRFLEVLPDPPKKKGVGAIDKLVKEWTKMERLAWKLTNESPFYGEPKGPKKAGPYDKPFKDAMLYLMEEMKKELYMGRKQQKDPIEQNCENALVESQFRTAVVDTYLPGMYLVAIRDRLARAEVEAGDVGFDEKKFEETLREAFKRRSELFLENERRYFGDRRDLIRKQFRIIGLKFRELSKMEHPLDFYVQ